MSAFFIVLQGDPVCPDLDLDGYVDASCGGEDCDDGDGTVHPGAVELCDGQDNDCDGALGVDEVDEDGDGTTVCGGDCDDGEAWWNQLDEDGDGVSSCEGDCWDQDDRITPVDPSRPMVFVEEGASGDGSFGSPFGEVQDALASDTLVCIQPGTYSAVLASSLAGLELLGPADGSAVIDGPIGFQNVNDSHVAGLTANSFNSTNSYSDASSGNVLEHLMLDCDEGLLPPGAYGAVFFGLGDRGNVLRDSTVVGCTVDASAKNDLVLGNTVVGTGSGPGITLDGPNTSTMWAWANLVVGGAEAGLDGKSGHFLAYDNLLDNGSPSQLSGGSLATFKSVFDDLVSAGGGYVSSRNLSAPLPDWPEELDVDRDGDDDRGDTLCVVGAWGEGSPLFAPHVSSSGNTALWTLCDGDGDEAHVQAAYQVQVAEHPFPWQPAVEHDSGEVSGTQTSTSLPSGGGWVRVRVRDESGAWSAWSDGLDSY